MHLVTDSFNHETYKNTEVSMYRTMTEIRGIDFFLEPFRKDYYQHIKARLNLYFSENTRFAELTDRERYVYMLLCVERRKFSISQKKFVINDRTFSFQIGMDEEAFIETIFKLKDKRKMINFESTENEFEANENIDAAPAPAPAPTFDETLESIDKYQKKSAKDVSFLLDDEHYKKISE